jgi:hypothetical protein
MKTRLATYTVVAMFVLLSPHAAWAGCHFLSFADNNIDSDKDISGEPNGRPLVRFYLVCHASLANHQTLNPDLGDEAQSIPGNVPLMVVAHGGDGNLLSFKRSPDLTPMESTYLMVYPQGVCDGDTGQQVVSTQRQTQTYNILNNGAIWPRNIVTSCTEDLQQTMGAMEQPTSPNAALVGAWMQSRFEWRSVKPISGDPADQAYMINCQGGIGSPCGFRLDDYNVPGIGMGVDARYAESDQYAYRDLRTIAGIVARVKSRYYVPNAVPRTRFLGFSSGAGLGLTILKYRHDIFDAYAFSGHPVSIRWVQAEEFTPLGPANSAYDAVHFASGLGFNQYPVNIGGPEGTLATGAFDLTDVGNWHNPFYTGTSNGTALANLNSAGINKKVLFVQGSSDMTALMRISRRVAAVPQSAGYGPPAPGDALPAPATCGTTMAASTSSDFVWQRYINHTAQFLDTTAGAATPAILDQLTCANTSWASVPAPPVLAPTNVLATCGAFGYPAMCGGDQIAANYVYEFGGGLIKMIIPATGGHTIPKVLTTQGGAGGGGNEIRDFSLAQEACIWFGDGCIRSLGY